MLQLAMCNPVACLDWMGSQVTRNKFANHYMLNQMEAWVEHYLIKHNNSRVRNGGYQHAADITNLSMV